LSDALEFVFSSYRKTHRRVLELTADLTDAQLRFQPSRTALPIAFHLWHLARYADSLPDRIGFEGGDIWRAEGLAAQWGLSPETLGIHELGTGMDAGAPGQLSWPGTESLLGYCRLAFESAGDAVGLLNAARLGREAK